ncbi:DUF6090 family protein [Kaistella jeonii]|uniref:Uncharacterized protein n=1 Tax=Kaistella jeonii TaxID=266749 RepID=A0A0C1FRD7_9FLAO|nr:DUF6090 family protein [Kaistella jeonii]KIA90464.1 hypothetical protein OA86_00770 [Kaistella jeonii]SFB72466.1 hypothetical protein SAMN05421876_101379 [Kaistella jeonii]VEI94969.1 Uncharacterised protein [Kaistella jeonii]
MAELEVVKSTKKIIETAKDKEKSFWHKIKEMALEIAVIIFAVSLSIAFHSWSEARHEQHQVRVFLKGVRIDLKKDMIEMKGNIEAYKNQRNAFRYLATIPKGHLADNDSIQHFAPYFYNFTGYGGNTGRYEGFKSSGKLGFIENDDLQNSILDLYEEKIPRLTISTDFYKTQKLKFADYITDNTVDYPAGNITKVMASNPVKNRSQIYLSSVNQIISNYENCTAQMEEIVKEIDTELPRKK